MQTIEFQRWVIKEFIGKSFDVMGKRRGRKGILGRIAQQSASH
jgi:hypothetical protein